MNISKKCIVLGLVLLLGVSGCMKNPLKKGDASTRQITQEQEVEKKKEIKLKPVKARKRTSKARIVINPEIDIYIDRHTQNVYIPEFNNSSSYEPAHIIMKNAFIHSLTERRYKLSESATDADVLVFGEVTDVQYSRSRWSLKSIWNEVKDGPMGRVYRVKVTIDLTVTTSLKSYKGIITGEIDCKESDIASAVNLIGVHTSKAILRAIRENKRRSLA